MHSTTIILLHAYETELRPIMELLHSYGNTSLQNEARREGVRNQNRKTLDLLPTRGRTKLLEALGSCLKYNKEKPS